jgi:hypothetical protein
LALPLFAVTLFVSAFLLFLVQPMIGKMIIPRLGGTPQVWNTCMVFFQMALLAGYAYTHAVSSRLKLRQQLIVHGLLLLVPFLILLPFGPFNISTGIVGEWTPPPGGNPIPSTLALLTVVVGLPFFVVSTSAPLLQRWFANTGHPAAKDPYFLYGASNLGSMLGLLAYPLIVEASLHLRGFRTVDGHMETVFWSQPWVWTFGYILLVGLFLACVGLVWNAPPSVHLAGVGADSAPPPEPLPAPVPAPQPTTAITAQPPATAARTTAIRKGSKQRGRVVSRPTLRPAAAAAPVRAPAIDTRRLDVVTWGRRLRWVLLAAVPSSLMLGITTFMSTDVSAIPLFWVIPLALYLLSFILVFSRWPVTWTGQPHTAMTIAQVLFVLAFIFICLLTHEVSPIWRSIALCLLAFFLTAMVCHGELARDRPGTRHLTEFYLWLSVGGMLGGMLNALIAPVLFNGLVELPLAIALACLLRPYSHTLTRLERPAAILVGVVTGLIVGWILSKGFLMLLIWTFLGFLLGFLYQPLQKAFHWSDNAVTSWFPGLASWAQQKGEELATGTPAATDTPPTEPRPRLARSSDPDEYYVLSYSLDVVLPLLVLILVVFLLGNQTSVFNTLKSLALKTLALGQDSAASFIRGGQQFILYLVPLIIALLFLRPIRFGLTITAILLVTGIRADTERGEETLYRGRSYFGILRVLQQYGEPLREYEVALVGGVKGEEPPYHYLMHGTTHHGLNYQSPRGLRRLATTYYHRYGPVGVIMERFNWFSTPFLNKELAPQDTYHADARIVASAIGMGGDMCSQLGNLWSDPPYACVGLGTGTMASYSRPFQHMTFYEIDDTIKSFHIREDPFFDYVPDAKKRGAGIEIIMGDARLSMSQEPDQHTGYYHRREGYYYAIELDAFSSDAIPIHLISKEAIQMYFTKLAPDGVLMVHTSNRHVDLVSPVTDVAKSLGLKWRVAKDGGKRFNSEGQELFERGLFSSEYVMLARTDKRLDQGKEFNVLPPETPEAQEAYETGGSRAEELYQYRHPTLNWYTPRAPNSRVWTDDYSNLISVFRWGF